MRYFPIFCCIALLQISLLNSFIFGNTIFLKGYEEPIGAEIIAYTEEYVKVIISRASVEAIDAKRDSSSEYGDSILLGSNKVRIPCKVLVFTTKDVTVEIPQEAVSSIYALGKLDSSVSETPTSNDSNNDEIALSSSMIDELTENIARRVRRETLMEKEAIEEGRMVVPEMLSREEQIQEGI